MLHAFDSTGERLADPTVHDLHSDANIVHRGLSGLPDDEHRAAIDLHNRLGQADAAADEFQRDCQRLEEELVRREIAHELKTLWNLTRKHVPDPARHEAAAAVWAIATRCRIDKLDAIGTPTAKAVVAELFAAPRIA